MLMSLTCTQAPNYYLSNEILGQVDADLDAV